MIEIKNLCFGYKKSKNVLENVNLNLKKGRIHGLLGKNGIGKSTLLKLIGGLVFPDSGAIKVGTFTPSERKVAFLSDLFFLPEELFELNITIDKFVKLNSVFYPNFSKSDFENYLQEFEISDTKQSLKKLSYGTKKKVLISFGLACHCKLLLFDEPTNGLDIPSKSQFRKVILRAMTDETCVIISTHQVRDLHNLIDTVLILDEKNVLLNATSEEVCNKLFFGICDTTQSTEEMLYSEDDVRGLKFVKENTENEESELNIELLFNAALSNKAKFKELFS
ncbi:MAG: ABC transporter ATP-binding protein [Bacteroidales bacterium]|nr:ABC transporter ATP-binding protein [Bacteroidales bacterium]